MATETDTTTFDAGRLAHRLPDDALLHGGIVFAILLMASPLLLAIIMSTQSTTEVYQVTNLGLGSRGLSNYSDALVNYDFSTYMLNSFVMSVVVVVGKVTLSLFAALALVYYRFPYERAVFMFILLTLLLPVPVRIVPLFQLMADLGWTNSLLALTGPYIASATAVFLFRQQFTGIPASLVEVARLDGVGPLTFLFRVLVPMSRGMIAGVCVITFIYTWNQFLWPLVVVTDKSSQVVQVGIRYLQGSAQAGLTQWGLIMAGAVLALLPPLVVLVVLHRPLLRTLTIQQK
ncbi:MULTISPECIES: carbohydrate ABC transporter permease [Haloferax]|uniref:sn-glycerol-3-phosphate transport system permease n=5 Tax=Haloferax volcanii TaxID=2246 RepID=A0A384KZ30_HALVD|nr:MULTISPECIES: carbohydrate ABC transporter permease [Haloferax]ADE01406.1 ABC-type transport system permease protein (probable substrate glycerol-3-phosphate) [Haloferax volcanii DS2]ELY36916.1 sn-glycerol-3-phosphate transport system permease [Haloferax volcanii DS2]ELZ77574.1 sn-glycerol-3-phosphate transport system permease [Haloferax lucentense DSM 14919]ELZ95698.1 sn-glycerol-3-phosphate transport system permease [Haloferax alexandrinus JCM 10717]MBS8118002.1 carbohydrate ABC transport